MSTGTVKFLHPGDLVWDYSSSRPTDATLRNAGVKGVSRYLTVVNTLTRPKMLTYDEAHHLADLGIAVMLNYEWNADDPLKGAARGVLNANQTNSYRHESGAWGRPFDWPDDVPVVVSLDIGVTKEQLEGPVTDYFRAFKDTYTGHYIGAYHGIFLHRRLQSLGISDGPFWTAGGAWSWSGSPSAVDDPPTDIVQRVSGVGGHNDLLAPVAFWDPNGEAFPPLEDDMLDDNDKAWLSAEIARQLDPLYKTQTAAIDSNGQPVFKDPFGTPMICSWQEGWTLETVRQVLAAVNALPTTAGGLTLDEIKAAFTEVLDSTLWATLRQT